jgi:hypothetical protein
MKLTKIKYDELGNKAKETYNFQKLSSILVDYGYATNWLNVDFESADFIAVHFDGVDILKIQLKGRMTIDKKYLNKDIYMAFPLNGDFYLVPHDELVNLAGEGTSWLESSSWIEKGGYSSQSPSSTSIELLKQYKL